jgi:2-hydroxychromene-2-carboxylate isomerase
MAVSSGDPRSLSKNAAHLQQPLDQIRGLVSKLKTASFAAAFDEAVRANQPRAVAKLLREAGLSRATIDRLHHDPAVTISVTVDHVKVTIKIAWAQPNKPRPTRKLLEGSD